MLTADLVCARVQGGELRLRKLDAAARARATGLAAAYLERAENHLGRSREELREAFAEVEAEPRDRRLGDGLRKLLEDRCDFDGGDPAQAEALRGAVFRRASIERRGKGAAMCREEVLAREAAERGISVEALEGGLYADLRGAQVLRTLEAMSAAQLVEAWELGQAQAALLRAVRVVVEIEGAAPGPQRALFHRLKFLRLLHRIEPLPTGGHRVEIDGPYSLFESVTRYGLQLALLLPALRGCGRWTLEAELRWGKERRPLVLRLADTHGAEVAAAGPAVSDEIAALLKSLEALSSPWKAVPSEEVLALPGAGLCVPDLVFRHAETGECVYFEALGFWSREAAWRRVELVERGLPQRILFAVGEHLRVSEAALAPDASAALYVYKRTLNARAIVERIALLAERRPPSRRRG